MTEHVIVKEQLLEAPRETVFAVFSDARNLEQITPPMLRFTVLTPEPIEMRPGSLIDYRLRVRGVPIRWRTEITEWDPPHRFVDTQVRGPYKLWHHVHEFEQLDDGRTLMRDVVRYEVGRGPLGALARRLFVARDVRRIFEYRQQTVPALLPELATEPG